LLIFIFYYFAVPGWFYRYGTRLVLHILAPAWRKTRVRVV